MSLSKNTTWNLIGSIAPVAIGAITVPYLLNQIGLEAFGILTLVWAMIGYFSLFDFGLGRVLTQQIAALRGSGEYFRLPSVIKTGLLLTLVTGLLGGGILAFAAEKVGEWLNVSAGLRPMAVQSLYIAAIGIPLTTLSTGLRGVLEADERFFAVNMLKLVLGLGNFGLPALSVWAFGPRLDYIVVSLMLARLVVLAGHAYCVGRIHKSYIGAALLNRSESMTMIGSGTCMTVSNIVSPLMVVSDRFVISYILGATVVAFYTVPFEVIFRMLMLPAAFTTALFPRLANLGAGAEGDPEFKRLYKKGLGLVAGAMFPLCLVAVCFSFLGLKWWINEEFAEAAWKIAALLAVGVFFNSVAQVPFAALQAGGRVRATANLHVAEFIVYLPLLVFALHSFGVVGAAYAWTLRAFGDMVVLLVLAGQKRFVEKGAGEAVCQSPQ